VWADTVVCRGADQDCISCNIATIRASSKNKSAHTGASYPGEFIFLDILHHIVPVARTKNTTFAFYLIIVDAFSRYVCIYGIPKRTLQQVSLTHLLDTKLIMVILETMVTWI